MSDQENQFRKQAEYIYQEWDKALSHNDVEGLLALYTQDIIIESPLIPHIMECDEGVCRGYDELRKFLEKAAERKPPSRKYHRGELFTDGKKMMMWEYPRSTPDGEQMDFMEVMELRDGLICYHRIYWGWRGFKVMQEHQYHR